MTPRAPILLLFAACSSGGDRAPPADGAPRPIDAGIPRKAARPDAAPSARSLGPITLDEVKEVLPVPAESRVLVPHHKRKGEERVEVAICFDRGDVGAVTERVAGKLASTGWEVKRETIAKDRADLGGTRGDLRLAGMVRRGPWAECRGERGQTYVGLAVYRPSSPFK